MLPRSERGPTLPFPTVTSNTDLEQSELFLPQVLQVSLIVLGVPVEASLVGAERLGEFGEVHLPQGLTPLLRRREWSGRDDAVTTASSSQFLEFRPHLIADERFDGPDGKTLDVIGHWSPMDVVGEDGQSRYQSRTRPRPAGAPGGSAADPAGGQDEAEHIGVSRPGRLT